MKPFKVVCIKDEIKSWTRPPSLFDQIVKGNIYTVIEIITSSALTGSQKQYYTLKEMNKGTSYACTMFRPIQDIGGQVEEHINKLIKEEDLKTISV